MKQSARRQSRSEARPPLDRARIEALALAYAGRYLTSRGRLAAYLRRKVRERGGPEDADAIIEAVVARAAANGFVDDRAFASARADDHLRRGFGVRRLRATLGQAGIESEDAAEVLARAEDDPWSAVLAFARRKRLGPYGTRGDDPASRRRAFAALVRAGHPAGLAARLLSLELDQVPD